MTKSIMMMSKDFFLFVFFFYFFSLPFSTFLCSCWMHYYWVVTIVKHFFFTIPEQISIVLEKCSFLLLLLSLLIIRIENDKSTAHKQCKSYKRWQQQQQSLPWPRHLACYGFFFFFFLSGYGTLRSIDHAYKIFG